MTNSFNTYYQYLKSLLRHKWFVLLVGLRVGGVSFWRLLTHDLSKFSITEFPNYARFFHGKKSKSKWAEAWLHHAHHNPHHPEYWILSWRGDPDFYNDIGETIAPFTVALPMPKTYVREMIIDMMASSKGYTGSYDIAAWLNEHGPSMQLHGETIASITDVMVDLGYFCADNCDFSWMAGDDTRRMLKGIKLRIKTHEPMNAFWIFGFERWGGLRPAMKWNRSGQSYKPFLLGLWIRSPSNDKR